MRIENMNQHTQQLLTEIEAQGWFDADLVLEPEGTEKLYEIGENWKTYQLLRLGDDLDTVTYIAKDDETALNAFHSQFSLREEESSYVIMRVRTVRVIIESKG
jgi:hypothetical protein